ncbi:FERM domain-containing protein 8, partial [Passer montanus]|uniref:FERM domain-containing protein 8 n=1 Tax=Passer montanus TaxID=9160 RepID=UPI00195F8C1B
RREDPPGGWRGGVSLWPWGSPRVPKGCQPCVPPPEVQLKPRHRPLRLVRHWPELLLRFSLASPAAIAQDEPCLQLRRNVFFPKSRELELQEEELLRLLYEEAREQLRGGRYPVDPPEAAELGGLSCRLRLGPFEPGRHTELSLRSAPAGPCPRDPPPRAPQHVLLSLTYPELCWELVGAVGQDGDPAGEEGDPAEPPQLWLEFDGDHEGAPVNRLLRVFSPQVRAGGPWGGNLGDQGDGLGAAGARGAPLRRQESVTRPRLQRLATIDYVREGQELRRVKPPRRSASFFSRVGGSYSPVAQGGTGGGGSEQG